MDKFLVLVTIFFEGKERKLPWSETIMSLRDAIELEMKDPDLDFDIQVYCDDTKEPCEDIQPPMA